ncbi:MAG: CHAT domain-containing protein [Bacteroidetes bacterium]|nr:CHAT domain-containing protein [Bacteroidota bacterium]
MKTKLLWVALAIPAVLIQPVFAFCMELPRPLSTEIEDVQRHLRSDEVMLEYHLTDSSVRVNAIARESAFFTTQSLDRLFWSSLKSFQKKLKSAEANDFLMQGEILYFFLVKPVQPFLSGCHRLIIIPGDRLQGLPFEALIRIDCNGQCNNLCNYYYLVHDFEVVYQSSRECWNDNVSTGREEHLVTDDDCRFAFVGFSPVSGKNGPITALPRSKSEITEIGGLFHQKGLTSWPGFDEGSCKDCFLAMAARGRIIHLATHHIPYISGCSPGGFLFAGYDPARKPGGVPDDLLTRDDIRLLRLHADLVVLNTCSSGADGTRAEVFGSSVPQLLYKAGARNILSTLWNVTDNLAEAFVLDFYRLWLSGKTYSAALREVKLQWINCRNTAIPGIWAAYVLMGE